MKRSVLLVFLFSFFLRVILVPITSLYWEEVALGYDAYSLLNTGKDHQGNFLPFPTLPSFGDFKPALYAYVSIPSIAIFGLNEWGVRLPSVLFGALISTVIFLFLRTQTSGKIALFAAFISALQPWGLFLSRAGFEANLSTSLLFLGFASAVWKRTTFSNLAVSLLLFVSAAYTYHSGKIVAPLLICLVVWYKWEALRKLSWKTIVGLIAFSLLISTPLIADTLGGGSSVRVAQTSWLSDLSIIQRSNEMKEISSTGFGYIVSHRFVLFAQQFVSQFLNAFRLDFFFLEGDQNSRHQLTEFGVFHLWDLVLLPVGLLFLLRKQKKLALFFLAYIAISAIPQSITTISPHTLRFASAYPIFMIFSSLGFVAMIQWVRSLPRKLHLSELAYIIIAFIVSWNVFSYYFHAFTAYPKLEAKEWQYGYKELFAWLNSTNSSTAFVMTREQGRPAMYYAFFSKLSPDSVQKQFPEAEKDQLELLELENGMFVDAIPSTDSLIISSEKKLREWSESNDQSLEILHEIFDVGGTPIWLVWRQL